MGILGRTLKYGDFKTRLFLVLTIVCCILGLGTLAACFVLPSIYLYVLCAVLLISGFVLGMRLVRADRRETQEHDKDPRKTKGQDTDRRETPGQDNNHDEADIQGDEESGSKGTEGRKPEGKTIAGRGPERKTIVGRESEGKRIAGRGPERKAITGIRPESRAAAVRGSEDRDMAGPESHRNNSNRSDDGKDNESRNEVNYSKAYVNKLLKLYHIKKIYTPIIIDKCDSLAISRCPAYVWDKGGLMYFLLFEPESRVVTMKMQDAKKVTYRKNVEETFAEGYEIMKSGIENFEEFEDVMPVYSSERINPYKSISVKNLYVLGKDMMITPKSLRQLRKKYDFDINIFDSFNLREQYSDYFKKAYESKIMWSDNIISQKEYQDSIREILNNMAGDMELTRFDVKDDIDRMVKYRLITQEYADFYKNRRS